jgi:hypothetical protein
MAAIDKLLEADIKFMIKVDYCGDVLKLEKVDDYNLDRYSITVYSGL